MAKSNDMLGDQAPEIQDALFLRADPEETFKVYRTGENFRPKDSIKINIVPNSIKNPLLTYRLEGIFQYQIKRTFKLILFCSRCIF